MTIMPKRIYLFGSFAKDTYNEDSDYDFLLLFLMMLGTKSNCPRKHINPFAEFVNVQ